MLFCYLVSTLLSILKLEISDFFLCIYAEALAKQHEAMKRALHLAERNKQLEKELKDIDQMALAVEAEANCTVQTNASKMMR